MGLQITSRARSRNFTEGEKNLLFDIVQSHSCGLKNPSWRLKNQEWQKVCHEFNSATKYGSRTWKQLRTLHVNMGKRKLYKSKDESRITAPAMDTTETLMNPRPEPADQCNDSKNVRYEDLPVIIGAVSIENIKQEPELDIDDSDCNYSCTFESDLSDVDQCATSVLSTTTSFVPTVTDSQSEKTCGKVKLENAIYEHKLKEMKEIHMQKLKAMQEIHEHELKVIQTIYEHKIKVKNELFEQELFARKEDHALKIDMKMKLFKLKIKNLTKKNNVLDLEIALKEKQLKK